MKLKLKSCECSAAERAGNVASIGLGLPGAAPEPELRPYLAKKICYRCGGLVGSHPAMDTASVSASVIADRLRELELL